MTVKIQRKDTYLAMIQHASGTQLFRSLFAEKDGEIEDILKDGRRSCAVFVSSVLYLFKQVESTHATVKSLEQDLVRSGW